MSNSPRPAKLVHDGLRAGEIRAIGHITLLDGTRWLKEIIAIKGEHLFVYHNYKRIYIRRLGTVGKEFEEIVVERKQEKSEKTWKSINGTMTYS